MTDEELGREWASKRGITPKRPYGGVSLWPEDKGDHISCWSANEVPTLLMSGLSGGEPYGMHRIYGTDNLAYAALGAAVRKAREELGEPGDDPKARLLAERERVKAIVAELIPAVRKIEYAPGGYGAIHDVGMLIMKLEHKGETDG